MKGSGGIAWLYVALICLAVACSSDSSDPVNKREPLADVASSRPTSDTNSVQRAGDPEDGDVRAGKGSVVEPTPSASSEPTPTPTPTPKPTPPTEEITNRLINSEAGLKLIDSSKVTLPEKDGPYVITSQTADEVRLLGSDEESYAVNHQHETISQFTTAQITTMTAPKYRVSDDHAWIVQPGGNLTVLRTLSGEENPSAASTSSISVLVVPIDRINTDPGLKIDDYQLIKVHYANRNLFLFEATETTSPQSGTGASVLKRYLVALTVDQSKLGPSSTQSSREQSIERFTVELPESDFPESPHGNLLGAGPLESAAPDKEFWLITAKSIKVLAFDDERNMHVWQTREHGITFEPSLPVAGVSIRLTKNADGELAAASPLVILIGRGFGYYK